MFVCTVVSSPATCAGGLLDAAPVWHIVSWNVANGPNTIGDDSFRTSLVTAGRSKRNQRNKIDILSLTETDSESAEIITGMMNQIHGTDSYESFISSADGAGDRTGIVYDSSVFMLIAQEELSDGLTHPATIGRFRPLDSVTDEELVVYSVNLKSGTDKAAGELRKTEAEQLRQHAALMGEGAHIIFTATFPIQGADDLGFVALTQPGPAQALELVHVPAVNWHDNPEVAALHTQDPARMLDDRFDMQLATAGLVDFVAIDYLPNSYHVVGNNGTHVTGESIFTGEVENIAEIAALVSASDHLPVAADYWFVPRLRAGDADADYDVDQLDLLEVLRAGKYLTGDLATWGEGDWDGAPGGGPAAPPAGDGRFNQRDIVAATTAALYLTGPYAEFGLAGQEATLVFVPEPSGLVLLVVACAFLVLRSWTLSRCASFGVAPIIRVPERYESDARVLTLR